MYCAYTIPGMGGNSLMYYYNGKAVSGRGLRGGFFFFLTSFIVAGLSILLGRDHGFAKVVAGRPHLPRCREVVSLCQFLGYSGGFTF